MAEIKANVGMPGQVDPSAFAMAINKEETDIIKKNFKGNDELLKAMRALLFGLGASGEQKQMVRAAFADDNLLKIIRKRFIPTLDSEMNIGQVSDVWLGVEQMIFGVPQDTIEQAIKYKERAVDMTEKGMQLLRNPDGEQISLKISSQWLQGDPLGINILARNQYIRHIEQQLLFLKIIASQNEEETPREAEKRRKKDGTR